MSWIDSRWEIWDAQALTAAEESRTNGNMLDMEEDGATDEMLEGLWFNVMVNTAFATLTSGVTIAILTSDSATFASGVKCIGAIGCNAYPVLVTELDAIGDFFSISIPTAVLHKYTEAYWVPKNEAATAGKLDAWFGLSPIGPKKIQKNVT